MRGEIRTRGSFWDNRLAVYRLTRLGHPHSALGYGIGILKFWIIRLIMVGKRIFPDFHVQIRKKWMTRGHPAGNHYAVFYMGSVLFKSPICGEEKQNQNCYILNRNTRKCAAWWAGMEPHWLRKLRIHGESRSPPSGVHS